MAVCSVGRAISGIAQEKSVGLAIRVLRLITRMGHYSYSPLTVARVHSLAARAHYEKLSASPLEMDAIIKDETAELDRALQVGTLRVGPDYLLPAQTGIHAPFLRRPSITPTKASSSISSPRPLYSSA